MGSEARSIARRRRKRGLERVTAEASLEAFEAIKIRRTKLYAPILETMAAHGPRPEDCLTAREILRLLKSRGVLSASAERNQISPRLTELKEAGCVEALDFLRRVAGDAPASVWRITPRGLLYLSDLQHSSPESSSRRNEKGQSYESPED
jgi:hypothetical protein